MTPRWNWEIKAFAMIYIPFRLNSFEFLSDIPTRLTWELWTSSWSDPCTLIPALKPSYFRFLKQTLHAPPTYLLAIRFHGVDRLSHVLNVKGRRFVMRCCRDQKHISSYLPMTKTLPVPCKSQKSSLPRPEISQKNISSYLKNTKTLPDSVQKAQSRQIWKWAFTPIRGRNFEKYYNQNAQK